MPRFDTRTALVIAAAVVCAATAAAADIAADPMRPDTLQSGTASAPARYRVNAIIVSDERRIAIVNGQRVGVGETIGGATVISISKSEVVVDVDGKRQSLRVSKGAGQ